MVLHIERNRVQNMPTGHDWPDEEPINEEDAVKKMIERVDRLNKGLDGDLWKMMQNCHKEVEEHGNMEHLPMCYIKNEASGELFYVCRKCLSEYVMKHPESNFTILRGRLTKEAEDFLNKRAQEEFRKQLEDMKRKDEELKKLWESDTPCPVCGKPFNKHSEEDFKSCFKQYAQTNPPDKDGGYNKP